MVSKRLWDVWAGMQRGIMDVPSWFKIKDLLQNVLRGIQ